MCQWTPIVSYIKKFYIRYKEDQPAWECLSIAQYGFRDKGIETVPFYGFGDVDEIDDLSPEVGVAGFLCDVWNALDKMGVQRPPSLDYPEELQGFLYRDIEKAKIKDVLGRVQEGIFCKPVKQKLFTGFVYTGSLADDTRLAPYDPEEEVWLSPVIDFLSEYRCYIMRGDVIAVCHYKGDPFLPLDKGTVTRAVEAFLPSAPVAYSLDFGIDDQGRTVLVEVNDAYSLGAYGIRSWLYSSMLELRWQQMAGK